jgi:hypothetical protein
MSWIVSASILVVDDEPNIVRGHYAHSFDRPIGGTSASYLRNGLTRPEAGQRRHQDW